MTNTTDKAGLWIRWKRLARRAAVVQSNVILWLLYYITFVPLALFRRLLSGRDSTPGGGPTWRERTDGPVDIQSARRQF